MKSNLKIVLIYVVLIGVIILATASLWNTIPSEEILYSDIRAYFVKEQVKSFVIKDATLTMEIRQTDESGNLTDKTKEVKYELGDISLALFVNNMGDLIDEQLDSGVIEKCDYPKPYEPPVWLRYLPYVLVLVGFVAIWFFVMKQASGGGAGKPGSFGKARAKANVPDKDKVYFKDVAPMKKKPSLKRSSNSYEIPRSLRSSAQRFRTVYSSWVLPERVKLFLRRRSRARRVYRSTPYPVRISLKCMSVSVHPECVTSSRRRARIPRR